jgi:hypothetical protein
MSLKQDVDDDTASESNQVAVLNALYLEIA